MDFQITPIQNPNLEPPASRPFFSQHKWMILSGLIIILIAVSVLYLLFGRNSFSEGLVDFDVNGQSEIKSGELMTYKISYQNNNKMALSEVKLTFFYPQGAVVTKDGNILNVISEETDIGTLESGASGEKTFTSYIVGDQGNIKTAKAIIAFRPANINSVFKKEISLASTITSLAIPLTLVAPPNIINGQSITYIIDYRNQSQQDYNDLLLKLKYPDGFRFSSAAPAPTSGSDSWTVPILKQSAGSRITIQGTITGNQGEIKTASLVLQKKITTPNGDVFIDFERTEASSTIATPYLSIDLSLNDSQNYVAHLGDDLNYKISFKNNSKSDLTDLSLTAKLDGSMFDLATVRSDAYFDSRTNTLTWNASQISGLSQLRASQTGEATFSVKLKNNFGGGTGAANSLVKASTHLETSNIPTDLETDRLAVDDQIITRISSAPTFDQKILLNDSQFGSNGPFPPKVNSTTMFTVRWTLINPSGDLSPAKITAVLAPGVKWEERTRVSGSQPQPTYDARTSAVTWDIASLPGGTGLAFPKYEADFQISITPSVNQVGETAQLIKSVRFDGSDVNTKEKISRTIQDASTSNIVDSTESGVVQD